MPHGTHVPFQTTLWELETQKLPIPVALKATPRAGTAAPVIHSHRLELTVTQFYQFTRVLKGWCVQMERGDSGLQTKGPLLVPLPWSPNVRGRTIQKHVLSVQEVTWISGLRCMYSAHFFQFF